MDPNRADKVREINIAFAKSEKPLDYPDVVTHQMFLINEKIKKVITIYDKKVKYKTICILNNLCNDYHIYYAPVLEKVECISEKSIASPDKSYIKKLVLLSSQINCYSIFKVSGLTDVVIFRQDMLESVLRRGIPTFSIVKLEIE